MLNLAQELALSAEDLILIAVDSAKKHNLQRLPGHGPMATSKFC